MTRQRTGVVAVVVAVAILALVQMMAWNAPSPSNPLAELTVDSVPQGAEVFLDGQRMGVTPLTMAPLKTRTVQLEVRCRGYVPYAEQVVLKAGDRLFRSVHLAGQN